METEGSKFHENPDFALILQVYRGLYLNANYYQAVVVKLKLKLKQENIHVTFSSEQYTTV